MDESKKNKKKPDRPNRYLVILIALWTALILASLTWNTLQLKSTTLEVARIEARAAYEKDTAYRMWNAGHGGVYVPVTAETQPNPYLDLDDTPERDITTPAGRLLTLINPSHMSRQVYELAEKNSAFRSHLTSLDPIRPENAADPWETAALQAFERGETEVSSVEEIAHQPYMRLMRPVLTGKPCLLCHQAQGYQEGDIRGGISISIPLQPLRAVEHAQLQSLGLGHGLLWLIGLGAIFFGVQRVVLTRQESEQAVQALSKSEERYLHIVESQTDLVCRHRPDGLITFANQAYCQFLGKTPSALIGTQISINLPDDSREDIRVQIASLNAANPIAVHVNQNINAQGEILWFQWTNQAILDQHGQISEYQSVGRNITKRGQAEQALTKQSVYLDNILRSATGYGIITVDLALQITYINPLAETYLGYLSEQVVGQSITNIHSLENVMQGRVDHALALIKKHGQHHHQFTRTLQGEKRQLKFKMAGITTPDEDTIGYALLITDTTEETQTKQLEENLYKISQAANQAASLDDLYPLIHESIQALMPAKNFYIALHHQSTDSLQMVYVADEIDATPVTTTQKGPTFYVLNTGQALLSTAAQLEALQQSGELNLIGPLPAIWLGVPLIVEGQAMGVMAMQDYNDPLAYGSQEQHTLEVIAAPVANIIANRRAQDANRAYAKRNALLFQAGKEISETLDTDAQYQTLYTFIAASMDCDTLIVSSFDASKEIITCSFIIHAGKKQNASALPAIPLEPEGQGMQSMVIRTGKSLLIDDAPAYEQNIDTKYYVTDAGEVIDYSDPRAVDEQVTQSNLLVALKMEGRITGVVQVMSYQRAAYGQEDLLFLEALASQIAVSAHNARLYQQAQNEIVLRAQAEDALKELNIQLEQRVKKRTDDLNTRVDMMESLNQGMSNMMNDLRSAHQATEENARRLEQANIELGSFSYSVSHDLRAPLRHVASFAQLLSQHAEGTLDETSLRYLNNILDAAKKMGALIDDLLALSRTGRTEMNFALVDTQEMVHAISQEMSESNPTRKLVWKIADLPTVQADQGLLRIAFVNLLHNAVKYTRPRDEAIIEVGTQPTAAEAPDNSITFFVRDNGVGFDPQYMDKLFGVFQRLHQKEEFEGTGIGLATVRRIIHRHHGDVWAESQVDQGATFYFTLPIGEE